MYDVYQNHLKNIGGINFTQREIDIIAISFRPRVRIKEIAELLDISNKTVETHIFHINKKLKNHHKQPEGTIKRDNIIDFIERSDKITRLEEYYVKLSNLILFKKQLKKISELVTQNTSMHYIRNWHENDGTKLLIQDIKKHLKYAGIELISIKEAYKPASNCTLFTISRPLTEQIKEEDNLKKNILHEKNIQQSAQNIFLLLNWEINTDIFKETEGICLIDFSKQGNYYFSIFEILKKILPNEKLDALIVQFKQQYKNENVFSENAVSPILKKEATAVTQFSDDENTSDNQQTSRDWGLPIAGKIVSNLPDRNLSFIESMEKGETESYLTQLWKGLDAKHGMVVTALGKYTIAGMGGIGKTQLALAFAYEALDYKAYDVIFWIHSETEKNIVQCYRNLLETLEIDTVNLDDNKIKQRVRSVLPSYKWLLIYDNLPNAKNLTGLPPQSGGHILVTSRDQNGWSEHGQLNLDVFSSNDAVKFLFQKTKQQNILAQEEEESALKIADELGYLPLALSHAASYMEFNKIKFSSYLKKLQTQANELLLYHPDEELKIKSSELSNEICEEKRKAKLEDIRKYAQDTHDYPFVVGVTWNISKQQLCPLSKQLFSYLCHCSPNDIPIDAFQELFCSTEDLLAAVNQLSRYNLIQHSNDEIISIHRLVQQAEQYKTEETLEILQNLAILWLNFGEKENHPLKERESIELYRNYNQVSSLLSRKEMTKEHIKKMIERENENKKKDLIILFVLCEKLEDLLKTYISQITFTLIDSEDEVNYHKMIQNHLSLDETQYKNCLEEVKVCFKGTLSGPDLLTIFEILATSEETKRKLALTLVKDFDTPDIKSKIAMLHIATTIVDFFENHPLRIIMEDIIKNKNTDSNYNPLHLFISIYSDFTNNKDIYSSDLKWTKDNIERIKILVNESMGRWEIENLITLASKAAPKQWEDIIEKITPFLTDNTNGWNIANLIETASKIETAQWKDVTKKILLKKPQQSFDPNSIKTSEQTSLNDKLHNFYLEFNGIDEREVQQLSSILQSLTTKCDHKNMHIQTTLWDFIQNNFCETFKEELKIDAISNAETDKINNFLKKDITLSNIYIDDIEAQQLNYIIKSLVNRNHQQFVYMFYQRSRIGYTKDLEKLKLLAYEGNHLAEAFLSFLHFHGLAGLEKNYSRSIEFANKSLIWLKEESQKENPYAANRLGAMYEDGVSVEQDYAEASRLYHLSAAQGHALAQFNLGVGYENGTWVAQNYVEAVRLYRLSANQGNARAMANLGKMYKNGKGVLQDDSEGDRFCRLAENQGNAWVQVTPLGFICKNLIVPLHQLIFSKEISK
jgi:TPR repeat protein/DNA-binding CsgD family transcriptional regulator